MNYKIIAFILGKMFKLLSIFLLLPIICSFIYKEDIKITGSFIITSVLCFLIAIIIRLLTQKNLNKEFYNKEGYVIVTLTWILFSLFGALPFYISGQIPSYVDSLFETVSGFTTTGSTILPDIESLAKSILLWRSFTHFIGGMGVIVFALAVLPRSPHNIHIAKAEMPGPYFGKVVSSIKQTAIYLYSIYIVLTIILFMLLLFGNIGIFDSLNIAFSTAGTGGFAIKNAGIYYYHSTYITIVVGIFMLIFSMNLNIIYFLVFKRYFSILKSEELRWFIGFIVVATVVMFLDIYRSYDTPYHSMLDVFFTVSSIVSTTGFTYNNFDIWPTFSKVIILLLMLIGGCAGGTAGGLKIPRFIFFMKNAKNSIDKALSPKKIVTLKIENKVIKDPSPLANYLLLFWLLFTVFLLLVTIQVNDFQDAFSLVVTTLSNAGPAFNNYGPMNNFSPLPDFTKIVLSAAMLLGRLELIPLIVLFSAKTWRRKHSRR